MEILNLPEHIRILEELLLHQNFSASPEALDAMFSSEFREINPKGEVISRDAVISWLISKNPDSRWEFREFEVQSLAPDLALATYHARQILPSDSSSGGARHCSIWKLDGAGAAWQLCFHQSTPGN